MTEIKLTEYQEKVRQAALNAENGDIIVASLALGNQ